MKEKPFFDFGEDRPVTRQQVIDREHNFMLDYFNAIGKHAIFHKGKKGEKTGIITEIGEDDYDYWIRVTCDGKDILESPLTPWEIIS